jgi:hypothetical protein
MRGDADQVTFRFAEPGEAALLVRKGMSRKSGAVRTPLIFTLWLLAICVHAGEVALDFSRTNGVIRPLHGVNLGPLCYRGMVDLSAYHRALKLPLTRLHDVVWVNYEAVDVSTIFRDFRNDPTEAASYDFAATDDYVRAVIDAGSPVLYRLGESIEHTPRKYRVNPPANFQKWAEVCCGIIRHYNEGWAAGPHHGIRYWEIWNEPENQPAMWTGTDEQFFELYEVTAKAIKQRWPTLKVGGPSLGDTGEIKDGRFTPGDFMVRFLRHCRERKVPLDFFSWHRYAGTPYEAAPRAKAIRAVLDAHGFTATESHFNEWNYLPNEDWRPMLREGQGALREQWSTEMGGPRSAAFAAWTLISLQDAPLDMANYYTAEIQAFGMFTIHGTPRKNFHAFRAFSRLLETPCRVASAACHPGGLAVCAGLDPARQRASILLSNFELSGNQVDLVLAGLPWECPTLFEVLILDAEHDLDTVRKGRLTKQLRMSFPEMTRPAVALIQLSPEPAGKR